MIYLGEGKGWFVLKMHRIFLSFQTLPVTFYTNTHTHTQTHTYIHTHKHTLLLTHKITQTKFIPIEEKSFIGRQKQVFLHLNVSNYEVVGILILKLAQKEISCL